MEKIYIGLVIYDRVRYEFEIRASAVKTDEINKVVFLDRLGAVVAVLPSEDCMVISNECKFEMIDEEHGV